MNGLTLTLLLYPMMVVQVEPYYKNLHVVGTTNGHFDFYRLLQYIYCVTAYKYFFLFEQLHSLAMQTHNTKV